MIYNNPCGVLPDPILLPSDIHIYVFGIYLLSCLFPLNNFCSDGTSRPGLPPVNALYLGQIHLFPCPCGA